MSEKREALARYAHDDAWSGWMKYMFSKMTPVSADTLPCDGLLLPMDFVERWQRQMNTKYDELPENEKESDRAEADKMLAIVRVDPLSSEEHIVADVIRSARTIQEFLWGEYNTVWNLEEWRRMFRKRVVKLEEIDSKNPHAAIEAKKRLLQTAALAVAMIRRIEQEGGLPDKDCDVPSNLSEYADVVSDKPDDTVEAPANTVLTESATEEQLKIIESGDGNQSGDK